MSTLHPFKGIHYNQKVVKDIARVMAPPYDVISPSYQDELYERDPVNIVRLILAKEGTENDEKYKNAADDFHRWLDEGVLVKEEKPAIYYYTQEYKVGEETFLRKGFIAARELEEFGKGTIFPHEKTHSGPKKDRLKLMKALKCNLSCIFVIYSDSDLSPKERPTNILEGVVKGKEPLIIAPDDDGVISRVWVIDDPVVIEKVSRAMDARPVFIADGHHRYETALNYRDFMRGEGATPGPYDSIMMYFSSMDDEGMSILPTHRAVHSLKGFNADVFLRACEEYFFIDDFFFDERMEPLAKDRFLNKLYDSEAQSNEETKSVSFGLYIKGRDSYFILTLKDPAHLDSLFAAELPQVYKALDVTILHSLILEKILQISPAAQEKKTNIKYIKDLDDAVNEVRNTENTQMVFLMNPTKIEQVKAVAEAGLVMPQKSTYFFPKLLTGLTINPLDINI